MEKILTRIDAIKADTEQNRQVKTPSLTANLHILKWIIGGCGIYFRIILETGTERKCFVLFFYRN